MMKSAAKAVTPAANETSAPVQPLYLEALTLVERLPAGQDHRPGLAADLARHRADIQKALLTDTRATLSKGLETLSDTARQQAYAAREAAWSAALSISLPSLTTSMAIFPRDAFSSSAAALKDFAIGLGPPAGMIWLRALSTPARE